MISSISLTNYNAMLLRAVYTLEVYGLMLLLDISIQKKKHDYLSYFFLVTRTGFEPMLKA